MGKIIERCAGIDVGKRFLLCCALTGAAHEEPRSKTLRFDTTVPALEGLHKWLREEGVTQRCHGEYGILLDSDLQYSRRRVRGRPG
jgi:hypothetical protein